MTRPAIPRKGTPLLAVQKMIRWQLDRRARRILPTWAPLMPPLRPPLVTSEREPTLPTVWAVLSPRKRLSPTFLPMPLQLAMLPRPKLCARRVATPAKRGSEESFLGLLVSKLLLAKWCFKFDLSRAGKIMILSVGFVQVVFDMSRLTLLQHE